MYVTPRYLGRGSWLSRRDPRVLVLVPVLFIFTMVQVWDLKLLVPLALLAYLYYRSARIPFREVRLNWIYIIALVSFIIVVNTALTGGELRGYREDELHVYFRMPLIGTPISAESVTYAVAQFLRFLPMAAVGFPIAFAIAPGDVGPTFARLRIPDVFAFGVELTFRFVPSLADDLRTTVDAQRVRGYEWERIGRTPAGKIRRMVPLMVPLTMNAIVGAEDTIDAMELRGFGTGRRTWLRQLRYERQDWATLAAFAAVFGVVTVLSFAGYTDLWVPPFLADLAH
jgi:energy-coupling factor transport system permease protein